jgi:hypothetical protein
MCEPPQQIVLKQSRPYRMRQVAEEATVFSLLVKLIAYMISGKSHIGASENPGNPQPAVVC